MKKTIALILCCLILTGCTIADKSTTHVPSASFDQNNTPATTIPESIAADDKIPVDTNTEDTMPEDTIPEDTIPEGTISEDKTPEETMPQETMQETTIPEVTVPEIAVNIYVPDENAESFYTIRANIPELNANLILELLIEYSMLNPGISLNSAELIDSQLNLDFNQPFLDQLYTYGTSGERMMIGCVVNTFLSIYCAESVFITVNGQIIESGHVIYDFPLGFIG